MKLKYKPPGPSNQPRIGQIVIVKTDLPGILRLPLFDTCGPSLDVFDLCYATVISPCS